MSHNPYVGHFAWEEAINQPERWHFTPKLWHFMSVLPLLSQDMSQIDSGSQETEDKPVKYQFTEYTSGHKPLSFSKTQSNVGSLFFLATMFPKNGVNLLLHEGPRHLGALQWALVSAGTICLQQGERLYWPVILHYDCNISVRSPFKLSEVCTFGLNLTVHYTIPAKLVLCCPGCWSQAEPTTPTLHTYIRRMQTVQLKTVTKLTTTDHSKSKSPGSGIWDSGLYLAWIFSLQGSSPRVSKCQTPLK